MELRKNSHSEPIHPDLSQLPPRCEAIVASIDAPPRLASRLRELGFLPGATLQEAFALLALGDAGCVPTADLLGPDADARVRCQVEEPCRMTLVTAVGSDDDHVVAITEVEEGRTAFLARFGALMLDYENLLTERGRETAVRHGDQAAIDRRGDLHVNLHHALAADGVHDGLEEEGGLPLVSCLLSHCAGIMAQERR